MSAPRPSPARARAGCAGVLVIAAIYGWIALTVDFPQAAYDIHSDEATYYLMGHSLAADGDLAYRREDLARTFTEFRNGPNGVFLKKGVDVTGFGLTASPPFVRIDGAVVPLKLAPLSPVETKQLCYSVLGMRIM